VDASPNRAQKLLHQGPGGNPGRGFARARAFEHVARIGVTELEHPDQVCVAGPGQVRLLDLRVHRPWVHSLLPVRVVAVGDQYRHGAPERPPVPHTGADLDRVLLDLHPAAPAVAELAARHLAIEPLAVELEAGGQALDDRHEPGAVRLACCCEAEVHRGAKARWRAERGPDACRATACATGP
jgi:hypothetical protein